MADLCFFDIFAARAFPPMRPRATAAGFLPSDSSILRVDPKHDPQIKAAREWAINLIEANAGGPKFSPQARAELLDKPLPIFFGGGQFSGHGASGDLN
jgi:hypothetical protein